MTFHEFKISVKASDVFMTAAAYQQLAEATDAPIHLGVTEAGGFVSGTIKSAIGLGQLLWMGIGDTLRVSLSADPVEEVKVGFEILKSLGLRHRGVNIISCPSCARQGFDVIKTVETLEERLAHIHTPMSLSIIGCVVNGPGEALMTDVGFTGGGAGSGMVYLAGKASHKMSNEQMVDHIVEEVEKRPRRSRRPRKRRSNTPAVSSFQKYSGVRGSAPVLPVQLNRSALLLADLRHHDLHLIRRQIAAQQFGPPARRWGCR